MFVQKVSGCILEKKGMKNQDFHQGFIPVFFVSGSYEEGSAVLIHILYEDS